MIRALAVLALIGAAPAPSSPDPARAAPATWTADNGDGTYTNPLFYEDFPDPDIIRVGQDYYLTGTTMHSMPGLPVLHSRDLVNWTLLGYAFDKLDLGPDLRLEGGRSSYGQGIWAPSLRYRNGTFFIFSNVNGHTTQVFRATNPAGPWTRTPMKRSLHDVGVLFDDDGKTYAVWGYREVRMAELNAALDDIVPGTERVIITPDQGMGEGAHVYKIAGTYYITSAWFVGRMRMPVARAKTPYGPYEVNHAISLDEGWGLPQGERLKGDAGPPFTVLPPSTARGRAVMHQGGIVDTPSGEWWGFSMMDYNSLGRVTALSPVTWRDGWPYFGLPGSLGRTPRTWVKPALPASPPHAPWRHSDDFAAPRLAPVWQWNHVPDDSGWSLRARPGFLRLTALPAAGLFAARNTLTQRATGPRSQVTVTLDGAGLKPGDQAGLALFGLPYAQLGLARGRDGLRLRWYDQRGDLVGEQPLATARVRLRADADFLTETARFSYSLDGTRFRLVGVPMRMIFQTRTFQGIRYSLYAYSTAGVPGGVADFDAVEVREPGPRPAPPPAGDRPMVLAFDDGARRLVERDGGVAAEPDEAPLPIRLIPQPRGRVALTSGGRHLAVSATGDVWLTPGPPGPAATFQWTHSAFDEPMLLSLVTNRYLCVEPATGIVRATCPGAEPDRSDHARLTLRPAG